MEHLNCIYCDKHFNFKELYDKHQVVCEFFFQSRRQRHREIESIEKMPSQQELFHLVQTLALQCKILTEKITKLEANNTYRIKRNAMSFLHNAPVPKVLFDYWINHFEINSKHLDEIFEYNLTNGMKKCISDRISNEGLTNIPIRAFKEKPGILYIYTDNNEGHDNDSNKARWIICTKQSFSDLIDQINNEITRCFCQWQNIQDEIDYEGQIACSIKISGLKINKDKQKLDIKAHILSIIQISL